MSATSANLDERTRRIIRTVEPCLRRHLGAEGLSLDLVGELYVRVREHLSASGSGVDGRSATRIAADLALQMYLTVVADETGELAKPELLTDLRHTLTEALKSKELRDTEEGRD